MTAVIYEANGTVQALALPLQRARVVVTPAQYIDRAISAVIEQRTIPAVMGTDEAGEPIEITPARTVDVEVSPARTLRELVADAVYRDETLEEMLARMTAAALLPDLPWTRSKVVADLPAGAHGKQWVIDWATGIVMRLGPQKAELKAYAAEQRWKVETGGMTSTTFGPLLTDRDTQSGIDRTLAAIEKGLIVPPIDFKGAGGWVQVDRATLLAIGATVAGHVQAAFSVEKVVDAAIDAGAVTTFAQVDNPSTVGLPSWPGSNPVPVPSIAETAVSGDDALARQVRYEIAMQAHNQSVYALEKLAPEATARGMTAAALADQIIAERQALEASVMHTYASNVGGTP